MKTIILSIIFSVAGLVFLHAQTNIPVCKGDDIVLHLNASTTSSIQWQQSTNGTTWNDISGAVTDSFTVHNIQMSSYYRAKLTEPDCAPYYSELKNVAAIDLPLVGMGSLPPIRCTGSHLLDTLSGSPSGGTFSGPGVSGNLFNPNTAGTGTHTIFYSYTSPMFGCTGVDSQTVNVIAGPVVSMSPIASAYCIADATVSLSGSPAGGSFSGNGVSAATFTPLLAGAGTHILSYSYTDPTTSCTATDTSSVLVSALPTISNAGSNITATSTTVQLNANTPSVGTGNWAIISGTGGSFSAAGNPQASFTGNINSVYLLSWTISNPPCAASVDTVQVTMPTGPSLPSVVCGPNTLYVHPTDNGSSAWGCSGIVSNAISDDDGLGNTALIVAACPVPTAAHVCHNLVAHGFSDWYLPAYNELECLRSNAATIGGFANSTYWSSTEGASFLSSNAKYRSFPSGVSGHGGKTGVRLIRCVRR